MSNIIPQDIAELVTTYPNAGLAKKRATSEQLQWFQDHNTTPYIVLWFVKHGLKTLDDMHCHCCGKTIVFATNNQYCLKHLTPDYAFCSPECAARDPIKQQRMKATNLERYGCEHVTQNKDVYKRKRATEIERYGEDFGKVQRAKASQTNLERYGATTLFHAPEYKQLNLEKYRDHFYESFISLLADKRIELVDNREQYCSGIATFHYRCMDCGAEWESTNHDVYHMNVCPCHLTNTKESAIYDVLKSLYSGSIIQHDWSVLESRKELDFVLPDLKIAIEFNGCYWHSTKFREDPLYHQQKSLLCAEKGFCLYQIYEDQWVYNRDNVVDKIKSLIEHTYEVPVDNVIDLDYNIIPLLGDVEIEQIQEPLMWYVYNDKRYDSTSTPFQEKFLKLYDSGKAIVRRK